MMECDARTRTEPQDHSGFRPLVGFNRFYALVGVLLFIGTASPALAAEAVPLAAEAVPLAAEAVPVPAETQDANDPAKVVTRQSRLADQFLSLERRILERAELEGSTNPQRAALLKQAFSRARQLKLQQRLRTAADSLNGGELGKAADQQKLLTKDFQGLLDLLLSEGHADRAKREKDRIESYLREVERLLRLQRSLEGRTEGGDELSHLADEEARVADRTLGLLKTMKDQQKPSDKQPTDKDATDKDNTDKGATDNPESSDKSMQSRDADGKDAAPTAPGEPPQATPGAPGSAEKPSESPSAGDTSAPSGGASDQEPSVPGQSSLEQAEQRMRDAEELLRNAQRDPSLDPQRNAEQLLEQAKADLNRILRQMREKEVEQTLAQLEGRFRKMLEMQLRVNEVTLALSKETAKTSSDSPPRETIVRASKLSLEERQIVTEADKALAMLREEGSSVVFPEVASQLREDMQQVARRLDATQLDSLTISIEEDIVSMLEEILESLKMARKEASKDKPQTPPQGGPPGGQQEQPLVNSLSELKMLRSLQLRVNQRTDKVAEALQDPQDSVGQSTSEELTTTLRRLSERESRIYAITRDIVVGRNK